MRARKRERRVRRSSSWSMLYDGVVPNKDKPEKVGEEVKGKGNDQCPFPPGGRMC